MMIPNTELEDDTIPVREDERFDVGKMQQYLANKLPGIDESKKLSVRQFGGGAANLTYLLNYQSHEYVLRRPPLGPVAKSSHDMSREYTALSALSSVFPYAPEVYLYNDDLQIIEAPFFIMERKRGIVIRNEFPDRFLKNPNSARQISEALVDALVEFHAIDYKKIGLSGLGKPEGFIERQIDGWYSRWNAAKLDENEQMDEMYQWLKENNPKRTEYALIHNDYKLDNTMYDVNDPSKLVAIFDWDMCTLGDPLSDLGALLTYWSEPSDPPYFQKIAMMPTADIGFLTRKELVHRYTTKSGRSVQDINFYHALGLFRLVVIIAQIYIRFVKKQTKDQRFAGFGQLIPLVIRAARAAAHRQL
jgi:aminoglycoside phosphotransferase (APT) family kinase protein